MKKIIIFLAFIVLGTVGLVAQDRVQTKLQIKDNSCVVSLDNGTTVVVQADKIQKQLQLQDGSCIIELDDGQTVVIQADKLRTKLQLQDGSCLDVEASQVINENGDRLRLRDGSCLDTSTLLQQVINAFIFLK